MGKEKTFKLILYKDCREVKMIEEENTKEGLNDILDKIEEWKNKDVEKNTVKFLMNKE